MPGFGVYRRPGNPLVASSLVASSLVSLSGLRIPVTRLSGDDPKPPEPPELPSCSRDIPAAGRPVPQPGPVGRCFVRCTLPCDVPGAGLSLGFDGIGETVGPVIADVVLCRDPVFIIYETLSDQNGVIGLYFQLFGDEISCKAG